MVAFDTFLAAIRERPSEWAPKLVLADWLEEQGDDRASLIRWWYQIQPALAKAFEIGRNEGLPEQPQDYLSYNWASAYLDIAFETFQERSIRRLAGVAIHREVSHSWPTKWDHIQDWPDEWNAERCLAEVQRMICDAELLGLQLVSEKDTKNQFPLMYRQRLTVRMELAEYRLRGPLCAWKSAFAATSERLAVDCAYYVIIAHSSTAARGRKAATKRAALAGSFALLKSPVWKSWRTKSQRNSG